MIRALVPALLALSAPAPGGADEPGDFDYYVLSLSWSPTWCALEGDERGSPQCDEGANGGAGFAWVLHGLWPQREAGWPSHCRSEHPDPSRAEARAMADIMGTDGLAWHAWQKHGTCSGLGPAAYFALSRRAFEDVAVPPGFLTLDEPLRLPARLVEEAFVRADPGLDADAITVTCRDGLIEEVRLCLTRDLDHRACGADLRDCRRTAVLPPVE